MDLLTRLLEPTTCEVGGISFGGPTIIVIPVGIAAIVCLVISVAWAFKDARRRGKNGILASLFIVSAGWPASLFWWQWIRPPIKDETQKTEQDGGRSTRGL